MSQSAAPLPFLSSASLPIVAVLEAQHAVLQREAALLLAPAHAAAWFPYVEDDAQEGQWDVLPLYGGGLVNEPLLRRVPHIAALLAQVPHIRQALLSRLRPGTHIKPHHGAPGIVRVHLALFAEAGQSGWRVADETRPCVEGQAVIFEDGLLHEAWNRGTRDRITLLFDTPAPYLTPQERQAVLAAYDRQMQAGREAALAQRASRP